MQNFKQDGKKLNWKNTTGVAVVSGQPVFVGGAKAPAVATVDIAIDATGVVFLEGVFEFPKAASLAITQGDRVYWDATEGEVTKTATDKPLGFAFTTQASNDTTVEVSLCDDSVPVGQAAVIAALGATTALTALAVTPTTIAASNFTAALPAEPTKAEVDAGIDTLKTDVVAALDLKADNADVETLRTQVEARLDLIDAKVDAILVSLKDASLMASA